MLHQVLGTLFVTQRYPHDEQRLADTKRQRMSTTVQYRPKEGAIMKNVRTEETPHYGPRLVVQSEMSIVRTEVITTGEMCKDTTERCCEAYWKVPVGSASGGVDTICEGNDDN